MAGPLLPGEGSYARLYPYADADGQAVLYRDRNASRPFLLEVAQDVRGLGVRCYAVPRRYAAAPLAEHLIGYLDGEGRGAAGLEAALDDILSTGGQDILRCAVTAQGVCGGAVSRCWKRHPPPRRGCG